MRIPAHYLVPDSKRNFLHTSGSAISSHFLYSKLNQQSQRIRAVLLPGIDEAQWSEVLSCPLPAPLWKHTCHRPTTLKVDSFMTALWQGA